MQASPHKKIKCWNNIPATVSTRIRTVQSLSAWWVVRSCCRKYKLNSKQSEPTQFIQTKRLTNAQGFSICALKLLRPAGSPGHLTMNSDSDCCSGTERSVLLRKTLIINTVQVQCSAMLVIVISPPGRQRNCCTFWYETIQLSLVLLPPPVML